MKEYDTTIKITNFNMDVTRRYDIYNEKVRKLVLTPKNK